jgi:hypothetical protein
VCGALRLGSGEELSWRPMGNAAMTFIQCEVELRRTDGRGLSTSTSLQMRPVVDQLINVPVDDGPWAKAKITLVKPLDVRNTIFEVAAVEISR